MLSYQQCLRQRVLAPVVVVDAVVGDLLADLAADTGEHHGGPGGGAEAELGPGAGHSHHVLRVLHLARHLASPRTSLAHPASWSQSGHFTSTLSLLNYVALYYCTSHFYPVNFTLSVGSGISGYYYTDFASGESMLTYQQMPPLEHCSVSYLCTTHAPLLQQITTLQAFISLNNIHILYQLDKQSTLTAGIIINTKIKQFKHLLSYFKSQLIKQNMFNDSKHNLHLSRNLVIKSFPKHLF